MFYVSSILSLTAKIEVFGITLSSTDITDVLIFNPNKSYSNIAATATKDELLVPVAHKEGRRSGSGDQKEKEKPLKMMQRM